MNIFKLSEIYRQPNSKRILNKVFDLPDEEVDKDALEIILYATEQGIRCKETADNIAFIIEESVEIKKDMFHIIQGLAIGDYVYFSPEMSVKIKTYLDKIGYQFYSPEDIELHGELLITQVEEIPSETIQPPSRAQRT